VVEPRRTGRRRVAMPKRPRVAAAPPAPGGAPGAGSRHPTPGPDESARCGDPEVAWRPPAGEPMGSARALAVRLTRAGVDPKVAPPVRSRRSPRDRASSARPEGPFGRGIRSAVAPRATRRRLGGADGPPRHGVAIERGSGCPARRAPPRGGWRPSLGRGPPTRPPRCSSGWRARARSVRRSRHASAALPAASHERSPPHAGGRPKPRALLRFVARSGGSRAPRCPVPPRRALRDPHRHRACRERPFRAVPVSGSGLGPHLRGLAPSTSSNLHGDVAITVDPVLPWALCSFVVGDPEPVRRARRRCVRSAGPGP